MISDFNRMKLNEKNVREISDQLLLNNNKMEGEEKRIESIIKEVEKVFSFLALTSY